MRMLKVPSWFIKLLKGGSLFLFVKILYRVLRRRSIEKRFRISRSIASIIYRLWKRGREKIKRNIALIRPDLNESQIAQGSWRAAEMITRSWAAMLGNEFTTLEEIDKRVEIQGAKQLLDDYHAGKRIIATAVHVGPIDEMMGIIPLLGLRVYVPAEPVKPKWLFSFMMRLRLRFGDIIFEQAEKKETLIQAARHLSDGRVIAFVIDMPKQDNGGVLCRIGNAEARFPVGPVKLALEQDATIFPVFPSWGENGKAKIVFGLSLELIRTGNLNDDIELNTRRLVEEVYAPHIQKHYDSWLRLLWINLEPARIDMGDYRI